MHVGDGALLEVNVEAQEMEVVHRFKFHWVAKDVVVDEGLNGWMVEEMFVMYNEAVVHIAIVSQCVEASCCGSGARSVQ